MVTEYKHWIRLIGPGTKGARVSGAVLRDLLAVLVDGARGAVRLRVEGRSVARGSPPVWLTHAADFQVLPLEEGSAVLPILAPTLASAVPERFAQESFLTQISGRSAVSLFEESLRVAMEGDEESDEFDQALLRRLQRFDTFLDGDIEAIEIRTDELTRGRADVLRVEPEQLETIGDLIRKTPPAQRARVAGTLDMIRHHDRMFSLQLDTGETVKGVAETVALDDLAAHWGDRVIVHGMASFRPSGRLLRIEADVIEGAPDAGSLWSRAPKPVFHSLEERELREQQGPRSGLNAIYGKWPGDESDDEIAEVVAEFS